MDTIHFKKVTVIGVGLIGGSLAIKLKEKRLADEIVGVGRGLENLEMAKSLGVVDSFTHDPAEGVRGADLVVAAVPVRAIARVLEAAAKSLEPDAVVTDVGSVKRGVLDAVEPLMPKSKKGLVRFVGGHPVAGTEDSGVRAAFGELFMDSNCILTPTENTDKQALETIRRLWQEAGATVVTMDAERHDLILAAISHLPHMVAYCLVNTVADTEDYIDDYIVDKNGEILGYSAGGFKDFTRIASSSARMWADISALNPDALSFMIGLFIKKMEELRGLIDRGDTEGLEETFKRAKEIRDSLKK
jgi:prephenate dehydrogenase